MKQSKLPIFTSILFLSILLGCTQDEITTATPQQSLFSVPDIGETKASFTEYNQGINLLSGVKNKTAGRNANAGYTINWGDSKQTTFKENVDILYTPVIKDFVSRKQKSFIASVKNEGKIESVLFTVYYTADFDSTSFTGYISQFTVKGTFLMLYKYTKGVLEKTITPKKEETTRQKRSKEEDCPPITMDYIAEILDMLEESGGGSVTLLGCANLDEDSGSEGGDGGGGSSWNTLNSDIYTPYKNIKTWITPFNGGGAAATSAGGNTNNNNTNDADSPDIDNDAPNEIINKLKDKADCVYRKLTKNSANFKKMIKKFDGDFPVSHLKFEESSNLPLNTNAKTSPPSNYIITIRINSNNLNRPNLSIARTIIHETIHAEMFRKILSIIDNGGDLEGLSRGQWISKLSNGDYPGIFDYYSRYGVNGMQHEQMAAHYISTISNYLKQFQPGLSQEIYDSLAWVGLKETTAWNSLALSKRTTINKTISTFNRQGSENCN